MKLKTKQLFANTDRATRILTFITEEGKEYNISEGKITIPDIATTAYEKVDELERQTKKRYFKSDVHYDFLNVDVFGVPLLFVREDTDCKITTIDEDKKYVRDMNLVGNRLDFVDFEFKPNFVGGSKKHVANREYTIPDLKIRKYKTKKEIKLTSKSLGFEVTLFYK